MGLVLQNIKAPSSGRVFKRDENYAQRCLHDRIPCRKYLSQIGLNIDPICPICKCQKEESIINIILEFKAVNYFWDSLGWKNYYNEKEKHWLLQVKDFSYSLNNKYIDWNSFFPFDIWNIWLNRNNNNQNNTVNPINDAQITQRASEFKLLTEKSIKTPQKILIKIKWYKPPRGWFKLNIDGSFNNHNQKCGLRGIFRNTNGKWVVGFAKSTHANGSLEAEMKALKEELKTTKEWSLFPLEIETDSMEVVHAPAEGNPPAHLQARE
ncbi:PREDICTED: uncharacterized protein LOC109214912 [Nicotiana attenuata]|uniref:uncharacterized protein LOC109214912 n=1 Tax=Nicotiana attenuata TaxID=49451 RepID=UPI000904E98C|nr:PREDICTED: uncharacterized protein LOC109214912 [Nicotiana attenuata]